MQLTADNFWQRQLQLGALLLKLFAGFDELVALQKLLDQQVALLHHLPLCRLFLGAVGSVGVRHVDLGGGAFFPVSCSPISSSSSHGLNCQVLVDVNNCLKRCTLLQR